MAFHPIDRDTDYLLPPSVQEWLPEAHLARYIVDVVEGLDLSALERAHAGRGSEAYHPATLLSLLIHGYATGTFSSRKIERATFDSLAFRYIACNRHPDHDTLATNDKEQVEPMVVKMQANPAGLNQPDTLLADTGYFSQKNVAACNAARITPLIAVKRDEHHQAWRERFIDAVNRRTQHAQRLFTIFAANARSPRRGRSDCRARPPLCRRRGRLS